MTPNQIDNDHNDRWLDGLLKAMNEASSQRASFCDERTLAAVRFQLEHPETKRIRVIEAA